LLVVLLGCFGVFEMSVLVWCKVDWFLVWSRRDECGRWRVQGVNIPKISGVPRGSPLSQVVNLW
jgi:hypothetical protein